MAKHEPSALENMAQAVRVSHCSRPDKEHACVGVCTISAKGVELDCKLCGTDSQPLISEYVLRRDGKRAAAILESAGLDFERLSAETQLDVIKAIALDNCPGCEARHYLGDGYSSCPCGDFSYNGRGWIRTPKRIAADHEKSKVAAAERRAAGLPDPEF